MLLNQDKVTVKVLKGINLVAADSNGKSDPYCMVSTNFNPKAIFKTEVAKKTLNPIWAINTFNFDITKDQLDKNNKKMIITFIVMDKDMFFKDDFLGETILEIDTNTFPINNDHVIQLPLQKTNQGTIEISIKINRSIESENERIRKEKETILNEIVERGEYSKVISNNATFIFPITFTLQENNFSKGPNNETLSIVYGFAKNKDFQQYFNEEIEKKVDLTRNVLSKEGFCQMLIQDEDVTEVLKAYNNFKIVKMSQWYYVGKVNNLQCIQRLFIGKPLLNDRNVIKITLICNAVGGLDHNDWLLNNEIFYNENYRKFISDILNYSILN
ncbi:hypothetical protein ABK040_011136 [Willaertia magna]